MKLPIILLTIAIVVSSLNAMEKDTNIDQKTKKKIVTLSQKGELSDLQKLLGPTLTDAHKYALEQALLAQRCDITSWLLDMGTDINSTYAGENTPLHIAAESDNAPLVILLLKNGADVNSQNLYKATPLNVSTSRSNGGVAQLIAEAKEAQETKKKQQEEQAAIKAQLSIEGRLKQQERLINYLTGQALPQNLEQLLLIQRERVKTQDSIEDIKTINNAKLTTELVAIKPIQMVKETPKKGSPTLARVKKEVKNLFLRNSK